MLERHLTGVSRISPTVPHKIKKFLKLRVARKEPNSKRKSLWGRRNEGRLMVVKIFLLILKTNSPMVVPP